MTPSLPAIQTAPKWPLFPYRGLSYYGQEDEALFGGRENDVEDCAHVLSAPSTRLLMLHGRTGCGKSSFLRAGLIPFLIRADAGFEFLTEIVDGVNRPMFVRCTYAPLLTLAEAVCKCTERKRPSRSPTSNRELPMGRALLGKPTPSDYAQFVSSNPAALVKSLEEIAAILPRTLVLVLDQAEEVLTLRPGADGNEARDYFFRFIRDFARSRFDLKMVICFRTEYYGEYDARINEDYLENPLSMRGYRLREFDHEGIVKAIKLPTQRTEIPGFGVPYQQYGFSYADDLPARIAKEIEQTVHAGALPAMQIVCQRLYELTRRRRTSEQWEINGADFDLLGGVEGQIDDYLTQALIEPCRKHKLSPLETLREIVRWRSVLHNLVRLQADGTVTTELVQEDVLAGRANNQKCKVVFNIMAEHLASEHPKYPRVLRHIESAELGSRYSLAHDVLGLTLQRWYQEQAQTVAWGRRLKWAVRIVSVGALLLWLMGAAFLLSSFVDFSDAGLFIKISSSSILVVIAILGIAGMALASTARMTDWLSLGWFFLQAALAGSVPERKRLAIMRDRRFRVCLEVVPRAREFLESTLRMGAAKHSNYWHKYRETETAVVFVHGIFSDSVECWRKDDQSPYWPDLALGDSGLSDAAIYLAGYYTALKTGPSDIRECSNLVFSALNRREPLMNPVMAKKHLIFVCHASGSLVVRDMLERNYPAFRDKQLGLLFIGATQSTRAGRLGHYFDGNLVRELDWAKQFPDVDERFRSLRADNRIPHLSVVQALEANAPAAPAHAASRLVLAGTDHLSCVRPENAEHPAHRLLLQTYQAMMRQTAPIAPAGASKPPVVFLAPPYPAIQLIPREVLKVLKREVVPGVTVALSGPAGTGKSALALEIAYDPEIKVRFPGGVLWATAGPHANVLALLGQWCAALGMPSGELSALGVESDRRRWVKAAIADRAFLIVIEDAPSVEVVRDLKVGGGECAYLVTVRDEATAASVSIHHIAITAFTNEESRALLDKLAPQLRAREPGAADALVEAAAGSPTELMLLGKLAAKQASPAAVKEIVSSLVTRQTNSENAVIHICLDSLGPRSRQMLRTLADLPPKPNSFAQSAALAFAGGANEFDELATAGMVELLGAGRCCLDEEIHLHVCQQLAPPDPEARKGLVEYYMDYVDTHSSEYGALETESRNVLAALDLAKASGWGFHYLKGALPFATYLEMRGAYDQAATLYNMVNSFAQQAGTQPGSQLKRSKALLGRARLAERHGLYPNAQADLQAALSIANEIGDKDAAAAAMAALSVVLDNLGQPAAATQMLDQGLTLDPAGIAPETRIDLLARRGRIATEAKDFELSEKYNTEALALAEQVDNREKITLVLTNLSMLEYYKRQLEQARAHATRGLDIAVQIGCSERQAGLHQALGLIAAAEGKTTEAEKAYESGLAVAERIGHLWYIAAILVSMGDLFLNQPERNLEMAEHAYSQALDSQPPQQLQDQARSGIEQIARARAQAGAQA